MHLESLGLNPWLVQPEKWQQLLSFNNQQQQYQMQGFHAPSFGNNLQSQTVNTTDRSLVFPPTDKEKSAQLVENEVSFNWHNSEDHAVFNLLHPI